jgi:hypothetical protein
MSFKKALVIGAISAGSFYLNPNYESNDWLSPVNVLQKRTSHYNFNSSGGWYFISYAAMAGCAVGYALSLKNKNN